MTNSIPPVDAHEPPAIIDDTHRPTWDILIERYKDMPISDTIKLPVLEMMKQRSSFGYEKHGTHLTPKNGRDSIVDGIQEILDFLVYMKNAEIESENDIIKKILNDSFEMGIIALETAYIAYSMSQDNEG